PVEKQQTVEVIEFVLERAGLERVCDVGLPLARLQRESIDDDAFGPPYVAGQIRYGQTSFTRQLSTRHFDKYRVGEHDQSRARHRLAVAGDIEAEHPPRDADLWCGDADTTRIAAHRFDERLRKVDDCRIARVDNFALDGED